MRFLLFLSFLEPGQVILLQGFLLFQQCGHTGSKDVLGSLCGVLVKFVGVSPLTAIFEWFAPLGGMLPADNTSPVNQSNIFSWLIFLVIGKRTT